MRLKLAHNPNIPKALFRDLKPGALFKLAPGEKPIKGIKPEEAFLIKLIHACDEDWSNAILTATGAPYVIAEDMSVQEFIVTGVEAVP